MPPYLRLVVPSACWNASKMIFCLSSGYADACVRDREGDDRVGAVQTPRASKLQPACPRPRCGASTLPSSVNLKAFESRFFSICCKRFASVWMAGGSPGAELDREVQPLVLRHLAEAPLDVLDARRRRRTSLDVDRHRARLDLREVEDVVDEREQVGARGVDGLGELDLLAASGCLGVLGELAREDEHAVERRAQLVRHVGEELRLVLGGQRQLLGLLLEAQRASSTSRFLRSTSAFCSARSVAFSSSSSFVCCNSSCCSSKAPRTRGATPPAAPAARSSSLARPAGSVAPSPATATAGATPRCAMLASMVLSTMPMLSVSWSRKVRCVSLKRLNEASSMTALTSPSKSTGSTTMLSGVASPRPEPMLDVICGDVGEQDALLLQNATGRRVPDRGGTRWRCSCARGRRSSPAACMQRLAVVRGR